MRFSNELDAPCDKDVQMGLMRHAPWGHCQRQWNSQ
jgi:hypothetical protein